MKNMSDIANRSLDLAEKIRIERDELKQSNADLQRQVEEQSKKFLQLEQQAAAYREALYLICKTPAKKGMTVFDSVLSMQTIAINALKSNNGRVSTATGDDYFDRTENMIRLSASQVAQHKAEQIEYQNKRKKPLILGYSSKTKNENLPCQCMYCGKYLDKITEQHANDCGNCSKDEFIRAGYVRFIRKGGS
jgi:hypothetical protein